MSASADPFAPPSWASPPGGAEPAQRSSRRAEVQAGLLTALVMVLLGAPVGLIWGALAPRVQVVITAVGPDLVNPETKNFIAADGWFLIMTAGVGLLCGVTAWILGRRHGVGVLFGLAVGGVLAALVAWKAGHRVGYSGFEHFVHTAPAGAQHEAYVDVRAKGVLVGWALAATLAFFTLTAIFDRDQGTPR